MLRQRIARAVALVSMALRPAGGGALAAARLEEADPFLDDALLPGAGPLRRERWFRNVWRARRAGWAARAEVDRHAVVFFGDSITERWGDDMGGSFPGCKVANRGISGDTTRGMLVRVRSDVVALRPSAVVILGGTNDLELGAEPDVIACNMAEILREVAHAAAGTPVVLCELFPSSPAKRRPRHRIDEVNRRYRALAAGQPHVVLLETCRPFADEHGDARRSELPDRLHPNRRGYALWAELLRPELAKLRASDR